MKTYKPRQKLGDRFQVRGFIPPAKMVDIADDRTMGMQMAFVHLAARAGHVGILARSCYMQGVNDAIDSLHKSGMRIVEASTSPADGDAPGASPGRGEQETAPTESHGSD